MNGQSSIIIYTTEDGSTNLQVKMENETVWLTKNNELKEVVRLMSRAITLQEQSTETEYSGLFNVITDYVYAKRA